MAHTSGNHNAGHHVAVTNPSPRLVAGRYRLSAVLGRGTMGTVWSAHDEVLGRPVAVKEVLLPPGIPEAEADAVRERTMREARTIAALSHPNVVTLYDVAREGAAPFVVMELVASRSLAELLLAGPLPPRQVIAVGAAVAAALQAAHAAGITHRDVKPGNVLVAHDGRIKLTDFGIARNPADQTLTATGLMLGSPAYIAPEIASGCPVSPAADLWGLGATLFSAVEGRPPYDAGTAMATVASVVHDEVPRASCSGPLAEVISGLMTKDPAHRMPLSQVRQLLGAPLEPTNPESTGHPPRTATSAPSTTSEKPPTRVSHSNQQIAETSRRRTGQLAADPGPLPFTVASTSKTPAAAHRVQSTGGGRRVLLWTLAVLLFLGAATTAFAVTRAAAGRPALPSLEGPTVLGARRTDDAVLTPRVVQLAQADGSRPARLTISVPQDWVEFREQRALGNNSSTVMRFVSSDGSEVIAVERVTGVLPSEVADQYLSLHLRRLAQGVPELVETQRQKMSTGAIDATFRTQEGGELRRTTYLRLVPAQADLWLLSVTVPTEREGAGRTKLFEPVAARFVLEV
ncbi:MAG TPA: serine/threonine-protein kinase [Pseudonocardiaceae bacterium]|nr:serine/threonine-protein kinase [Pseudonocardiaceae bacterium]